MAKPPDLTDRQRKLLDEIRRARGGVKRIPNARTWRDYVADELESMGLIVCRIEGCKRHLSLAPEEAL